MRKNLTEIISNSKIYLENTNDHGEMSSNMFLLNLYFQDCLMNCPLLIARRCKKLEILDFYSYRSKQQRRDLSSSNQSERKRNICKIKYSITHSNGSCLLICSACCIDNNTYSIYDEIAFLRGSLCTS